MATAVVLEQPANVMGSYVNSWRPWMALYGLRLRPAAPASHQVGNLFLWKAGKTPAVQLKTARKAGRVLFTACVPVFSDLMLPCEELWKMKGSDLVMSHQHFAITSGCSASTAAIHHHLRPLSALHLLCIDRALKGYHFMALCEIVTLFQGHSSQCPAI